jgi:putative transposase
VYLDGIHFDIRHGDKVDSTIILVALGVDLLGSKEVLALRACAEESKDGWACLLQDLRTRGATRIDLIVTDGHDGRLSAVDELFPATLRQRCLVHKQRNVMNAIPKREQQQVAAELVGIWKQEKKEDALLNLAASTRQIPSALSGSHTQPERRRRASFDLLCLPTGHASLYSQHQCD